MPKRDVDLAARIREFRLEKELTHEEAMVMLEISNGTYFKILRGEKVSDRIRAIVENRLNVEGRAA